MAHILWISSEGLWVIIRRFLMRWLPAPREMCPRVPVTLPCICTTCLPHKELSHTFPTWWAAFFSWCAVFLSCLYLHPSAPFPPHQASTSLLVSPHLSSLSLAVGHWSLSQLTTMRVFRALANVGFGFLAYILKASVSKFYVLFIYF